MAEELRNEKGAPLAESSLGKEAGRNADQGTTGPTLGGFYSDILTESERLDFDAAIQVEGLDEEIALFRIKIKALAEHDPQNTRLIMNALIDFGKLVKTRYSIGKGDKKGLAEKVAAILKDIALPMGVIGATLKK